VVHRKIVTALVFFVGLLAESQAMDALAQQPTVMITGSNRGIGLEFVRQYSAKGWTVIATTRRPMQAKALQQFARAQPNVTVELLDVTDGQHLSALVEKYDGQPIDVLINNAGVSGDFLGSGQSFGTLDYTTVDTFMSVNAIGPLRVTEAFYENIKLGKQKKVVAITALLGVHSFEYGNFPGAYWYKVSKAAMNAAVYNLSKEASKDGITVAMLTPGEVAVEKVTDPGPSFITPEVSIRGMIGVIAGLSLDDAGTIIRYSGKRYDF